MNIDKMIMEFVENSRYSCYNDNLIESEQIRLKTIFDDCLSSIVKEYTSAFMPTFIICNTYNKYSEILPVRLAENKYKYYLLYDCHLTEINRLFDALYFDEEDSGHDIWKLSYELFAEDALIEDDELFMSYYSLNKVALGAFKVNYEDKTDLEFILDIQERYIIGHELGHWVYKVSSDENASSILNIDFGKNRLEFLESIKEILCDVYTEYEKIFKTKEYVELILEQNNIIKENSGILEECFADAVAYAMVFRYIQFKYSNEQNKKILAGKALFLEMMNLQLLAMQHMTTSENSFESSTSIRLGFFRNYVGLYFNENEEMFNNMLNKSAVRYEQRISNLMIDCFSELEKRADNIYDALIDVDGKLDTSRVMGLSDAY